MSLEATVTSAVASAKAALGDLVATYTAYNVTTAYATGTGETTQTRTTLSIDAVFTDITRDVFPDTIAAKASYAMTVFADSLSVNDVIVIDGAEHSILFVKDIRASTSIFVQEILVD